MSKSILFALCLGLSASFGLSTSFGLGAAWAQTAGETATTSPSEAPAHKTHGHHHAATASDGQKAPEATPVAADPAANMFKPYAHAGEGDDDGLSRNEDDCNKGCIDQ